MMVQFTPVLHKDYTMVSPCQATGTGAAVIPLRECNYGGSTLSNKTHTIPVKSRVYTSLVDLGPGGCSPPNSTAR